DANCTTTSRRPETRSIRRCGSARPNRRDHAQTSEPKIKSAWNAWMNHGRRSSNVRGNFRRNFRSIEFGALLRAFLKGAAIESDKANYERLGLLQPRIIRFGDPMIVAALRTRIAEFG